MLRFSLESSRLRSSAISTPWVRPRCSHQSLWRRCIRRSICAPWHHTPRLHDRFQQHTSRVYPVYLRPGPSRRCRTQPPLARLPHPHQSTQLFATLQKARQWCRVSASVTQRAQSCACRLQRLPPYPVLKWPQNSLSSILETEARHLSFSTGRLRVCFDHGSWRDCSSCMHARRVRGLATRRVDPFRGASSRMPRAVVRRCRLSLSSSPCSNSIPARSSAKHASCALHRYAAIGRRR